MADSYDSERLKGGWVWWLSGLMADRHFLISLEIEPVKPLYVSHKISFCFQTVIFNFWFVYNV